MQKIIKTFGQWLNISQQMGKKRIFDTENAVGLSTKWWLAGTTIPTLCWAISGADEFGRLESYQT